MKYLFKRSLYIPGYDTKAKRDIKGKDFPKGIHEVPEMCELHPHFLKYVGASLIVEAPKVAAKVESPKARGEKLLNKLVKQADAKKAKAAATTKEPVPADKVSDEDESPTEPVEKAPEVVPEPEVAPKPEPKEKSPEQSEEKPKGRGKNKSG